MQIKDCSKCGNPLDSVDHLMQCTNKNGNWHGSKEGTGPWD